MSEILKSYTPKRSGRPSKYPWNEWLDGNCRRLKKGKDFSARLSSMELLIRRTAKTRPEVERVEVYHEPQALVVQAFLFPPKKKQRSRRSSSP